jgi:hypothetical protein
MDEATLADLIAVVSSAGRQSVGIPSSVLSFVSARPLVPLTAWGVSDQLVFRVVYVVFERKWGNQERHGPSLSAEPAPVDPLTSSLDAIVKYLRQQPLCPLVVRALQHVCITTKLPYVRDQTFKFFFEWVRWGLSVENRGSLTLGVEPVGASAANTTADPIAPELGPCLQLMITAGLTDLWSAIRKSTATKLQTLTPLLGFAQVCVSIAMLCLCDRCMPVHTLMACVWMFTRSLTFYSIRFCIYARIHRARGNITKEL